jgi:tripartite-type tricarboxylate transporter receptor subunit TctC
MALSRRHFVAAACGAPAVLLAGAARAQDAYPNKPISLIMPFPAGITTDVMTRLVVEQMAADLKQPVVTLNRAGASGVVGTRSLAASPADGYTIGLSSNGTIVAAMSLFRAPGYDPIKSFAHIGGFAYLPWALVVSHTVPASNVRELIAHAKANPRKLAASYYSSSSQLCASQLQKAAGIELLQVPYKSSAQVVTDLANGQLQLAFLTPDVALAQSKAGVVKLLAFTTPKRWAGAPDAPVMGEELPGFEFVSWVGLAAPAGTPAKAVEALTASLSRAMAMRSVQDGVRHLGGEPVFLSPAQVVARIQGELPVWQKFVAEANITPQ